MKLLLDTHIALWALTDDERLPLRARQLILSSDSEIWYSTVSVWEIAIKHMIHPENMPIDGKCFADFCRSIGYEMLAVVDEHVFALETLHRDESAARHNDPFDRLLIAQAKAENMIFVTHDKLLPAYNESCILLV